MECFVIDFENLESVVVAYNSFDLHFVAGWASFVMTAFVDSGPN